MIQDWTGKPDMRDFIWVICLLLFVYAIFELYRGLSMRWGESLFSSTGGEADFSASEEELNRFVLQRTYTPDAGTPDNESQPTADPWGGERPLQPPPPATGAFKSTLEIEQLRREVAQLQGLLAGQRREMDEVMDEVRALKAQLEAAAVSQSISPEYNEALVFARRGLDVDTIAERCGISRSEAELVHALAQRRDDEPGQENDE